MLPSIRHNRPLRLDQHRGGIGVRPGVSGEIGGCCQRRNGVPVPLRLGPPPGTPPVEADLAIRAQALRMRHIHP